MNVSLRPISMLRWGINDIHLNCESDGWFLRQS